MPEPGRRCTKCGETFGADVLYCPRDGSPLSSRRTELTDDPYLGLILSDGLRLDQLIGIGAMGRVYRAHETRVERDVAVKILHRELLRNPILVARFEREARAAARLAHPNVISVHRVGELAPQGPSVGGEPYMVLEYLDGISLRSALAAAGGAIPLPRALHVVLQICDAVGEAHARGIVHRDLKPDNIMLVRRGDDPDYVKVLDFGVARLSDSERELATQAGAVLGTARYISPEGARGDPVGAPGDVYSITTMLFECLSGTTPFEGESPVAILVKQTSEPAKDVRSVPRASYVPEPIALVIAQNLAKDPGARCRDARELGRTLVAAAHDSGLKPEELLPRSTLLGTRPALHLASIERTRAMRLEVGLQERLREGAQRTSGPQGTAIVEGTEGRPSQPPQRPSQPPQRPSQPPQRPSQPPQRASQTPAAPSPVPKDTPASATAEATGLVDPTLTEADWESLGGSRPPPPAKRASALQRGGLIAACFVAGAAVALVGASGLGAFEDPEPGADAYVARAEKALATGALVSPRGENVRDISDTALRRWPGQPRLLALRGAAAKALIDRARKLGGGEPSQALELLRAADELDPNNSDARRLAREFAPEPPAPASASAPPIAAPSTRKSVSKALPAAAPASPAPPIAAPSAVAPPAAGSPQSAQPEGDAPGGRWL